MEAPGLSLRPEGEHQPLRVKPLHRHQLALLTDAGLGDDGLQRFEGTVPLERAGSFGYSVRVLPHSDRLPDADLGLLASA